MLFESIIRWPDHIRAITAAGEADVPCSGPRAETVNGVTLDFALTGEGLQVSAASGDPLKFVSLRWNTPMPEGASYCGDHYERSYGSLEWRHMVCDRRMPWYFLGSLNNETRGYGVKVRCAAICFWQADAQGITLWMDLRSGGVGVELGQRVLNCATVVSEDYVNQSAFEAACHFCGRMCTDPRLPDHPVYGSNNWYYAYGVSSHQQILRDADLLAELTEGLENRPYMVVDSCWQSQCRLNGVIHGCNGGPWFRGNSFFPDMKKLAEEIKARNQRPGIWIRPLLNEDPEIPDSWRDPRLPNLLDPSVPEVLEYIQEDVRRIAGWGYELLKFDFSTYDVLGIWEPDMNPLCTRDGWQFHDRSRTTGEILISFYEALRDAAPQMILIGCNCIGHLIAGIAQLNRIGDDTSGRDWERTRNMGINTLAFRLPQNRTFFMADADCMGMTPAIPWELNRQWAHLLAYSGTPLFVSIDPDVPTPTQKQELKEFFRAASFQTDQAEPLDWMYDNNPRRWNINGREVDYRWNTGTGAPITIV